MRSSPLPVALITAALVLATAAPAAAHVEVSAPGAETGDRAILRFSAAGENPDSGITELATRLPEGVPVGGISLASGPEGWTLTVTDDGFVVGGAPLPVGEDAEYSVVVATLPDDDELFFPTLQRYADGREDAWIEPSTPDLPHPAMPAPVLVLGVSGAAGDGGATSAVEQPAPSADAVDSAATSASDGIGTEVAWYVGFGVLAVLAVGAGTWFWRRRAEDAA